MIRPPFIVAVSGGSASGKSSFVRALKEHFSQEELCLLTTDNYYLPLDQAPVDDNGVQNFDIPESIDHALFLDHVARLKAGQSVQKLEYTFNKPGWVPQMLQFNPTPIIILEGIFSLHFQEIREITDLKLYIDADPAARFDRRIARDGAERGLDLDDVEYRWRNHIMPVFQANHDEYKRVSDLIIVNNFNFNKGVEMVVAFLRSKLTGL